MDQLGVVSVRILEYTGLTVQRLHLINTCTGQT